jgi:Predicted nucleic-acid-binding protein, contains PIN domain
MIAVDTNILARLLIADDKDQLDRVLELLSNNTAWVSRTVTLELAWVLRSRYNFAQSQIAVTIQNLLQAENLVFEDEAELEAAMELAQEGIDIADAIHLCCVPSHTTGFKTFDNSFIKMSSPLGFDVSAP